MSAETSPIPEDIISPEAWGERTVATVSVSPWYRVPDGSRHRTVNLTCANNVIWEQIHKGPAEPWMAARKRTEKMVCKMLREMMKHIEQLAL